MRNRGFDYLCVCAFCWIAGPCNMLGRKPKEPANPDCRRRVCSGRGGMGPGDGPSVSAGAVPRIAGRGGSPAVPAREDGMEILVRQDDPAAGETMRRGRLDANGRHSRSRVQYPPVRMDARAGRSGRQIGGPKPSPDLCRPVEGKPGAGGLVIVLFGAGSSAAG